jgi:hypothetical protein
VSYEDFLAEKATRAVPTGIDEPVEISEKLFGFQRDIVAWALRRGRAALFADTGLGKTAMQLEWARHVADFTGKPVLILAPLAVAAQTAREGEKFGLHVEQWRVAADFNAEASIAITNYDRLHHFIDRVRDLGGVVLDESSILKDYTSATRTLLIETFAATGFKLACTATPAPNDFTEMGNHAEFLGVLTRVEMLATWFVHDGGSTQDWRLKGHAIADFYQWVCSWAVMLRRPSDLGYDDGAFALPALEMNEHVVASSLAEAHATGKLFVEPAKSLDEQRKARRASLASRVAKAAEIVNAEPDEPWLVWCELNDEGDALTEAITDAVQIAGSDNASDKEHLMLGFCHVAPRIIVTKPSIAGYGMNWQHCARIIFVGVSHSFEQFYQAVRRCWRFGQKRPVKVHVITSEAEGAVVASLKRKESDARRLGDEMVKHMADITRASIRGAVREATPYEPRIEMRVPHWLQEAA